MGRIATALFVFGCIAGAARAARAATLDPFRAADAGRGDRPLDPFRVAQALPMPPREEEKPKPAAKPQPAAAQPQPAAAQPQPAAAQPQPAAAQPQPAAAPPQPAAKACQKDEDCSEGNICKANTCQPI